MSFLNCLSSINNMFKHVVLCFPWCSGKVSLIVLCFSWIIYCSSPYQSTRPRQDLDSVVFFFPNKPQRARAVNCLWIVLSVCVLFIFICQLHWAYSTSFKQARGYIYDVCWALCVRECKQTVINQRKQNSTAISSLQWTHLALMNVILHTDTWL